MKTDPDNPLSSEAKRKENVMAYARRTTGALRNSSVATLIAYDLQAGRDIAAARANPEGRVRWCGQLSEVLNQYVTKDAIRELMHVARRAVILFEPIYELANMEARARMRAHGYVRGLKEAAERLGAKVFDCRLLAYTVNALNPSGLVLIEKEPGTSTGELTWRCPMTRRPLNDLGDVFASAHSGMVYPELRGIPMLRAEQGVVASKIIR